MMDFSPVSVSPPGSHLHLLAAILLRARFLSTFRASLASRLKGGGGKFAGEEDGAGPSLR